MSRVHVAPSATANGWLEVYGAPPLSVVPSEQLRLQPTSLRPDPLEQVIAEEMVKGVCEGGDGGGDGGDCSGDGGDGCDSGEGISDGATRSGGGIRGGEGGGNGKGGEGGGEGSEGGNDGGAAGGGGGGCEAGGGEGDSGAGAGEGGVGEGCGEGGGKGEDGVVARSTGSHCGGQVTPVPTVRIQRPADEAS
eukprot:scaffold26788_cov58-Phaeocystis_antarctica.AAC.5